MQTLTHSRPKASKPHKCMMCCRIIDPGEVYTNQANLGDDGFYTWKNCRQCDVFYGLIEDWDGYGIGDESVMEWEPGTVRELRIKALWRKKWRHKDGTLYEVPLIMTAADEVSAHEWKP
jgi:hypothetical protein